MAIFLQFKSPSVLKAGLSYCNSFVFNHLSFPISFLFYSQETAKEVSLYSVIFPQLEQHNKGFWCVVERLLRKITELYGEVLIMMGLVCLPIKLKNGITFVLYWVSICKLSLQIHHLVIFRNIKAKKELNIKGPSVLGPNPCFYKHLHVL